MTSIPVSNLGPPDIILIVADDVNYKILSQSQCPIIHSLMGSGTNFTEAYNYGGSGGAVCKSSRQMMLFGEAWDNSGGRVTFPTILRQNGYFSYATGKWHNSDGIFNSCFDSYQDVFFGGMISRRSSISHPSGPSQLGDRLPGGVFTNSLVSFIQEYNSPKPYFAYM